MIRPWTSKLQNALHTHGNPAWRVAATTVTGRWSISLRRNFADRDTALAPKARKVAKTTL